jgi:hypothetical protein
MPWKVSKTDPTRKLPNGRSATRIMDAVSIEVIFNLEVTGD